MTIFALTEGLPVKQHLPRRSDVTVEQVRQILDYNPETGVLTWKNKPREMFTTDRQFKTWNTRFSGKEAGNANGANGYRNVGVLGVLYLAHRIIWMHYYGEWPNEVDHINHDRYDNRISNLQEAVRTTNMQNSSLSVNNTSGFNGVQFRRGKWLAVIGVNNRRIQLGTFSNFNDAVAARIAANKDHKFHPNHGR